MAIQWADIQGATSSSYTLFRMCARPLLGIHGGRPRIRREAWSVPRRTLNRDCPRPPPRIVTPRPPKPDCLWQVKRKPSSVSATGTEALVIIGRFMDPDIPPALTGTTYTITQRPRQAIGRPYTVLVTNHYGAVTQPIRQPLTVNYSLTVHLHFRGPWLPCCLPVPLIAPGSTGGF